MVSSFDTLIFFSYYLIFPLLFSAKVLESNLKRLFPLTTPSSFTLQPSSFLSPFVLKLPFQRSPVASTLSNLETLIRSYFPWPLRCMLTPILLKKMSSGGFPGGAVVENLPANAGDTGSSPGLGA